VTAAYRRSILAAATFGLLLMANQASGEGYPALPVVSGSQTVVGEPITYPSTGKAVLSAMILTLAPGEATISHSHGVPVFGYILEGEVTIDYGPHGVRTYTQGQGFLEAMQAEHAAHNNGAAPVRILAVYMGAEGSSDVIAR
jgi:quercetin dioxygenase-like cupin family protein